MLLWAHFLPQAAWMSDIVYVSTRARHRRRPHHPPLPFSFSASDRSACPPIPLPPMRSSAEMNVAPAMGPEGSARHLTVRGLVVGLAVGLVICCSNMYFGLQTGFVSSMALPSSLLAFGIFRSASRHLSFPFSPIENVLVQSVAGAMAIAPLGAGFVGVLPAMNYLLTPEEQGPIDLSLAKMVLWALGLCYFGVIFAVPLRRQVIIREKLKFPSGFSTAVLIGVLHGRGRKLAPGETPDGFASLAGDEILAPDDSSGDDGDEVSAEGGASVNASGSSPEHDLRRREEWRSNLRLLLLCFLLSGLFTVGTYFVPAIRSIPIFGRTAAQVWLWSFNPSLAYIGQGVIMGPATTLHMLLGAVVGWAMLSPLAKYRGWAAGPINDWETGSKGWIVWVSIAIMLADGIVSLAHISSRSIVQYWSQFRPRTSFADYFQLPPALSRVFASVFPKHRAHGYTAVSGSEIADDADEVAGAAVLPVPSGSLTEFSSTAEGLGVEVTDGLVREKDAPPEHLIGAKLVVVGLVLSIMFCIVCIRVTFGSVVPLYATCVSVVMALLLSIMGVRALGETDLNPVSGISKLTQLFFALIVPGSQKSSILINLIAGAVSESGALQAAELMQDLKTGHLLGAAPSAQFWGQMVGSTVGAIASAILYKLYTTAYEIPSELFQIPTGYVWIFTARLVTGNGLPPMAAEWAIGAAVLFAGTTLLRIHAADRSWHSYVPGGIAVAMGMYNVPSFTLARALGGVLSWYWKRSGGDETKAIVVASGFMLGEGFLSVANLIMQSAGVPHM